MLIIPKHEIDLELEQDSLEWFMGYKHGHMSRWQFSEPRHENDPVRGLVLYNQWGELESADNLRKRQKQVIQNHIYRMVQVSGPASMLVDLGTGDLDALKNNTIPYIDAYEHTYPNALKKVVTVDFAPEAAEGNRDHLQEHYPHLICEAITGNFFHLDPIRYDGTITALMMGSTIGNFPGRKNTPNAILRMGDQIKNVFHAFPVGTTIFIGLEATQDQEILYHDYGGKKHAEFEMNLMHRIKRDVLFDQPGFVAEAWRYKMKWCPSPSHQFCHLAKATQGQHFTLKGTNIIIPKSKELVIDSSFKFPIPQMREAAILAKKQYIHAFPDQDSRMVIHALRK